MGGGEHCSPRLQGSQNFKKEKKRAPKEYLRLAALCHQCGAQGLRHQVVREDKGESKGAAREKCLESGALGELKAQGKVKSRNIFLCILAC